MQAVPDSTQSDLVSADKKERKKGVTKKKKRKAESKDSKHAKKKKTGKGKGKASASTVDTKRKPEKSSEADGDDHDLDLSVELKPMGDYIKDREEMLRQMFRCIQADRLTAIMPSVLKNIPLEEVKALCLTELEGMSKKRIRCLLAGQEMISSSGTEESDSETDRRTNIAVGSPLNQVADSTCNLQASENQSEHSVESGGGSRASSMEPEYEEETTAYEYYNSEQEFVEGEANYHRDEQMQDNVEDTGNYAEMMEENEEEAYEEMEEQYVDDDADYIKEEADNDDIPQDGLDQRSHSDDSDDGDKQHLKDKESSREEQTEGWSGDGVEEEVIDEKETKYEIPKRRRKDVDARDIEEGEVFDDDEEPLNEEAQTNKPAVKAGDVPLEISTAQEELSEQVGDKKMDAMDVANQDTTSKYTGSEPITQSHLEQGKDDMQVLGKVDMQEQDITDTQKQANKDICQRAKKEVKVQGYEHQQDQVSDLEGHTDPNPNCVDIANDGKHLECTDISSNGTISIMIGDSVGTSEHIERITRMSTGDETLCVESQPGCDKSPETLDLGATQVFDDNCNSCLVTTREGDMEVEKCIEPSVIDNTEVGIGSHGDNEVTDVSKADVEVGKNNIINVTDMCADTVDNIIATCNVAVENTADGEIKKTEREIETDEAVATTSSGSDSDSSGDETDGSSNNKSIDEDEQGVVPEKQVESKQLPEKAELEMLELELRARAIRSLMQKMGKE